MERQNKEHMSIILLTYALLLLIMKLSEVR